MDVHPLRCSCGTLKGFVTHPERVNRVVCYCRDCQAFARFLRRASTGVPIVTPQVLSPGERERLRTAVSSR
jgi:hypothetical protein